MGPLDALWHLLNLGLPAFGIGVLAAALAKLVFRRELAGVRWQRLAAGSVLAASLVLLAGVVITGRDGRMATYSAMVVAVALTLWWLGFGPGRR